VGLNAHPDVPIGGVPPVVPPAWLDHARLALAEDARPPVALNGQLTVKDREAFDHRWVAMLAQNAGPDEGDELGDEAVVRILPRELEDGAALTRDGILPNLSDLNRSQVRRAVRVGMRHPADGGSSVPGR
jgi:hypothetical protein